MRLAKSASLVLISPGVVYSTQSPSVRRSAQIRPVNTCSGADSTDHEQSLPWLMSTQVSAEVRFCDQSHQWRLRVGGEQRSTKN